MRNSRRDWTPSRRGSPQNRSQRRGKSPGLPEYVAKKKSPVGEIGFGLFVDNIPFDCTHEDLLKIFIRYGKVVDVFIPCFPITRKPRGFPFVRFLYEQDAKATIDILDGRKIDGRVVTVRLAKPRSPPPRKDHQEATRQVLDKIVYDYNLPTVFHAC